MNRRNILIGLGVVAAGAAGGAYWLYSGRMAPQTASETAPTGTTTLATASGEMPIFEDDRILGDAAAPVTILEYSSLTCPHCAAFHSDTLPQVKAEWIDSGRARLVYRHYPLDQVALRAAAVANCIPGNGFFGFLDVLFANQTKWAQSQDPFTVIAQYAALAGLDKAAFEACLNDEAVIDRILELQSDGRAKYDVASTPTFVVNGTPVAGNRSYEEFNSILESAATAAS
ncbi:MAG: thioredoxin domain-containing protein [Kiloniellaceae bacterium]|jgi:protein-disulfide isomerase|nr:thioredoxin domain-containing protein [Kiloniellaceae bacterium]